MGLCKDCKFWDIDYDGECERVGYADIDLDDSSFELECGADDDQGSYAKLITGPNFGCIKFEPKKKGF